MLSIGSQYIRCQWGEPAVTKVLLSVHVLVAILAIGPIAVAASMFPRYARQLAAEGRAGPVRPPG